MAVLAFFLPASVDEILVESPPDPALVILPPYPVSDVPSQWARCHQHLSMLTLLLRLKQSKRKADSAVMLPSPLAPGRFCDSSSQPDVLKGPLLFSCLCFLTSGSLVSLLLSGF